MLVILSEADIKNSVENSQKGHVHVLSKSQKTRKIEDTIVPLYRLISVT